MTDKEKQKHIDAFKYWCVTNEECGVITIPKFVCDNIIKILDNTPTVEPEYKLVPIAKVTFDEDKLKEIVQTEVIDKIKSGELVLKVEEQPISECRTCKYRDPEGKTCDRLFPVSDNYFCEFYKESDEEK